MERKWSKLLRKAFEKKCESQQLLHEAVVALMREKGFAEEIAVMFDCDFAGGNETIIKFNSDAEMCDLDLIFVSAMTKEEIISNLKRNLSEKNYRLINGKIID